MALFPLLLPPWHALVSGAVTILTGVIGLIVITAIGYLVFLLGAASLSQWRGSRRARMKASPSEASSPPRIAVVIPAHNEELVLAETLDSLNRQTYPRDRYMVVVVADNCTDTTARIAGKQGAFVLERFNTVERGKGYALAWAFEKLLAPHTDELPDRTPEDAFVIVDADTWVAPDFLEVMGRRLSDSDGAALQGYYGVLNPQGGWRAALMQAAFDLFNHIRPLGADRLGLSVGLKGNGMAFHRTVLERAPWQGRSITEDIDYGLDLLEHHNTVVRYVPQARVLAQMPVTAAQAASQRERWERGRYRLLRERVPQLFRAGIRRGNLRLLIAALDLSIPPLAELTALLFLWGILIFGSIYLSMLPGRFWPIVWVAAVGGLLVYVLGGLKVAKAPRSAFLGLLFAPAYLAWKFMLVGAGFVSRRFRRLLSLAQGKGEKEEKGMDEWVRTERIQVATEHVSPDRRSH
jgi:cellulose synthase/poly-beta-1,6-N-acetylglucosamine synthase-like glycosyltransferase